jgi:hypothetical protein
VIKRDGTNRSIRLPTQGDSWLPVINGSDETRCGRLLIDICTRISCGVATGADEVFVRRSSELDPGLRRFAYPTLAGRELTDENSAVRSCHSMLIPYDEQGTLLPFESLGALGKHLQQPDVRARLRARFCAARKPWYAFHETPRIEEMLRPKILCKDIGDRPRFWCDWDGAIVPRHSIYYIVPQRPEWLQPVLELLRSDAARDWLAKNCQRASKGFLRIQSRSLQRLPLPCDWAVRLGLPAAAEHIGVQEAFAFV